MKYARGEIIELLSAALDRLTEAEQACYRVERGEKTPRPGKLQPSAYVNNARISVSQLKEAIEEAFLWGTHEPAVVQH